MEATYNIVTGSISEVRKYLTKLQNRAKKAGHPVFTFSFDEEVKTWKFHAENVEGQGDIITTYSYRVLHINQDITVHEGWTPIAKLDVTEKQMRCYSVYQKEIETLGDKMWTKHCDHCGHNKIVHTAFVMQKGNEFMKVGKGCMKDLAPLSAVQIAKEFDIYARWSDYLKQMTMPEDGGMSGGGGKKFGSGMSVEYVYKKSDLILAMRAALEITNEWVVSIYSNPENGRQEIINKGNRTFDFIQSFLSSNKCMIPDQKYVDSVNKEIDTVINKYSHVMQPEKLTELKTFAEAEKTRVIDIFLVKTVQRIIEKEAEKNKMRGSSFQGEVGTKVSLTLELVDTKHGQGAYGGWTLWIFKDVQGNMFKKFGNVSDRFKTDQGYQFTAPIKSFETYDEIKYTVLGGPLSKYKAEKKVALC